MTALRMLAESPRFKHVKYLSLDFFLDRVKGIKCQRLRDIENVHFSIKFLKYLFATIYQINETNKVHLTIISLFYSELTKYR